MFGIKNKYIPFALVRPSYIPPIKGFGPIVEGDEYWQIDGENAIFHGGLAGGDGSYL